MKVIKKILIANRGEIACRVIQTCRALQIQSVTVYSDSDRDTLAVQSSDESYHLGSDQFSDSYLNQEKIIEVALSCKACAIHPGYGFLSENAEFAKKCETAGLIFLGPSAASIEMMGDKSHAKDIMQKAGVPVVPGYQGKAQDLKTFESEIQKIGFPVLLKPSAGGGGKGMRRIYQNSEIKAALEGAKREAQNAFGNDHILVEKLIEDPKHIEVQIFGDQKGHVISLFERDCSIQRRNQKIIEEAPAITVPDDVKQGMYAAAVNAAKAVNYVSAGTVEFIYSPQTKKYYFMEMNTRLQVEHPVTEMITGCDLVQMQIEVACGGSLPKIKKAPNGHALEVRIYAEDALNDFLPSIGKLKIFDVTLKNNERLDTGGCANQIISPYFDPMIAKLIVWGADRAEAVRKMITRLENFKIWGVQTNIPFLIAILKDSALQKGDYHTGFLNDFKGYSEASKVCDQIKLAAICLKEAHALKSKDKSESDWVSPWQSLGAWGL